MSVSCHAWATQPAGVSFCFFLPADPACTATGCGSRGGAKVRRMRDDCLPTALPFRARCPLPQTALLTNTLVCLPTGLGKTLIAAVVMHNFARWFPEARAACRAWCTRCLAGLLCTLPCRPGAHAACQACCARCLTQAQTAPWFARPVESIAALATCPPISRCCLPPCLQGKVVFVAPTKPLVAQQVDACHSFMGMSKAGFCELTGAAGNSAGRTLQGRRCVVLCAVVQCSRPDEAATRCFHHALRATTAASHHQCWLHWVNSKAPTHAMLNHG